ncbi:hypothetical protein PFISCL1PPCAC_13541, partial [Pristionchus fissidentatus]
ESNFQLLTVASFCRALFYTFSMFLPLTMAIERFLATQWWEWYERESPSTFYIFVAFLSVIEIGAIIPAVSVVFEVYSLPMQLVVTGTYSLTGFLLFLILHSRNKAYLTALKARRITTRYTVARHYQIRENLIVLGMLRKIAIPACLYTTPGFICFTLYLIIPSEVSEFAKLLSVALFDLIVALYV